MLARALAQEREKFCEALRILSTLYAPNVEGGAPTALPECLRAAFGIVRTSSRFLKDAARAEPGSFHVFDACYG